MDNSLIGPGTPLGYPAPYWFLVFFKVLGFSLHMIPMNLWYAGLITMLIVRLTGGEHARRLSDRVINAMPVIIAMGVNFGIVPLLFTQVAYYRVFYPATILMAWPWFGVIVLVLVAYYGVYIYVVGLRRGEIAPIRRAAGWAAGVIFIGIGFLFANSFSLMTDVGAWKGLWEATSVGGAVLGTALHTGSAVLWPRWLMMFGLALTTTAAYVMVDVGFFAGGESDDYRRWARGFALRLATVGVVWFAVTGSWYIFGALAPSLRAQLLAGPLLILTIVTALAVGVPWLLILFSQRIYSRGMALAIGLAQYAVLALNAVSRQILQNAELAPYLDVTAEPVHLQLSPLVLFLVLFVVGLGIVVWMVVQVVKAYRQPAMG